MDGYESENGNYQWFDKQNTNNFADENGITWTKITNNKDAWNEATTIRDAVVTGLVKLGNDETEVEKDVRLFPGDSPLFTKEAKLNNSDKYVSSWVAENNSETGLKDAMQSIEISNTGCALKFYKEKGGMKKANAIGVVKSAWSLHVIEGGIEKIERIILGSKADNDPISDMHYGNAKDFLNKISKSNNTKLIRELQKINKTHL
jgi:hypothetical protein